MAYVETFAAQDQTADGLATRAIELFRQKPMGVVGGAILLFMVSVAVVGPFMVPFDPLTTDVAHRLAGPYLLHPLGTDQIGRDTLARLVYGARTTMSVAVVATLVGASLGAIVGILVAYAGGKIDLLVQRVFDVLLAFPTLILALAIMAALGQSANNVILAIVIPFMPRSNRVVRSAALSVKELPYIQAARALGLPHWRILLHHVVPNCLAPYLITASVQLGSAIIVEASLSFLGLGPPEPMPSWGRSLSSSMPFFEKAPWLAIFPGLAISLAVFGANLLGDALRDIWDPRLRTL